MTTYKHTIKALKAYNKKAPLFGFDEDGETYMKAVEAVREAYFLDTGKRRLDVTGIRNNVGKDVG